LLGFFFGLALVILMPACILPNVRFVDSSKNGKEGFPRYSFEF
jgi:hypothetical protein